MRIIAGLKRGMKLVEPRGDVSRPILDRVKESLFSVLYKYDLPADAVVADVFAGVGSLGLEALSRGARACCFVERDPDVGRVLQQNIAKTGWGARVRICRLDAYVSGAPVDRQVGPYDLVFVDPPYPTTYDVDANSRLAGLLGVLKSQVKPDAIVTVRTHRRVSLLERYSDFKVLDRRQWGTMAVTLLALQSACWFGDTEGSDDQ